MQEKIIDELDTEMEGTSNRLDFVQVSIAINCYFCILCWFCFLSVIEYTIRTVPDVSFPFFLWILFNWRSFFPAEKGGHGNEESWGQGSIHDDFVPSSFVYYFVCVGFLHLRAGKILAFGLCLKESHHSWKYNKLETSGRCIWIDHGSSWTAIDSVVFGRAFLFLLFSFSSLKFMVILICICFLFAFLLDS